MDSASSRSNRPGLGGLLGKDGSIDLGGRGSGPIESECPTVRPSSDAWSVDRDRRSLLPPPGSSPRPENATPTPDEIHRKMDECFALGDYAAALSAAELQLGLDPNDERARRFAETSRQRLEARYLTQLGSLDSVFNHAVAPGRLKWLGLDPQTASLLSQVDGQTTVDQALAACPMGRLEALRVFVELLDAKAIVRVA